MSDTALLVIDMLNSYRHEDAEKLTQSVADIVDPLAGLIAKAQKRDDIDLIYVNDNYGDFTASQDDLVRQALEGERPDLVRPIVRKRAWVPAEGPPQRLLRHLPGVSAAPAGYRAADRHRPGDRAVHPLHRARRLCAPLPGDRATRRRRHIEAELGTAALRMMEENMRAEIVPAAKCLN